MRPIARRGGSPRGSMLLLAMFFVLLLAVVGVLVVRHAGRERIATAQMVSKERAFACAEAGLQYGRGFFALNYEASAGWNDYLDDTRTTYKSGYKYDPAVDSRPSLSGVPAQVKGKSNGSTFDPGADYDGNQQFWVSIRDDDDEVPAGQPDNPRKDNNEAVFVRSECTAFYYIEGGEERTAAVEALLVHVQNASGYGNAQITSNSPDVVGQLGTQ